MTRVTSSPGPFYFYFHTGTYAIRIAPKKASTQKETRIEAEEWGMKRLFLSLTLLVITNANLGAQATAQIAGTVRDQSGAVLPGVEVTATQTDTSVMRTAVTNET